MNNTFGVAAAACVLYMSSTAIAGEWHSATVPAQDDAMQAAANAPKARSGRKGTTTMNHRAERISTIALEFPNTRPESDPVTLRRLQIELLDVAQGLLGTRDLTKRIHQPSFHPNGPRLLNTPNLDGAYAELSPNAAGYWPTTVYEMAHETIHMLNPTVSYTNCLEEGVAVAFSEYALALYGLPHFRTTFETYRRALELVSDLPGGPFEFAKRARVASGALNKVTLQQLTRLAPSHDPDKLRMLASTCITR